MNSPIIRSIKNLSIHTKIFIGWAFVVSGGLYAFTASRNYIVGRRHESMKTRERMQRDLSDLEPIERTPKSFWW